MATSTAHAAPGPEATDDHPTYAFGDVPDIELAPGERLEVVIEGGPEGARCTAVQASPAPEGPLAFDVASGLLEFTPGPKDRGEFVLTFAGDDGSSHEAPVLVRPPLTPEFAALDTGGVAPDPTSARYVLIEEQPAGKAVFNQTTDYGNPAEAERETLSVAVSAVHLILDPKAEGFPLKPYATRADVRRYDLYADEIVVRGRITLPGAELHIHCRELRFEDPADGVAGFTTTPLALTETSSHHAGNQGEAGGDIYLHVRDLVVPPAAGPRLITRGARGQAARPGEAGADGGNRTPWDGTLETTTQLGTTETLSWDIEKEILPVSTFPPVAVEVFEKKGGSQRTVAHFGYDEHGRPAPPGWPHEAVRVPGGPGSGGRGGDVYTAQRARIEPVVDAAVGAIGEPAKDLPGAKAGEPRQSSWIRVYYTAYLMNFTAHGEGEGQLNRKSGVELISKYDRKDELPVQAPRYPVSPVIEEDRKPREGEIRDLPGGAGSWLHPRILRALTRYLTDAFRNDAGARARDRFRPYRELLAALPEGAPIDLVAASRELVALVRRMEGPFDFYGKPAGWVPMLSFEASLDLYEREVPAAIRALYLAALIEKNQGDVKDAAATLEATITALQEARDRSKADHDAAQAELLSLRPQVRTLEARRKTLQAEFQDIVADLERKASGLRLEDALRGAGKVVGGILQALPVGQPVTGIIGGATSMISDMDFEDGGAIATDSVGFVLEQALDHAAEAADHKKALLHNPDGDLGEKDKLKKSLATKLMEERAKGGLKSHEKAVEQIHHGLSNFCVSEETIQKRLDEAMATDPGLEAKRSEIEDHNRTKAALTEKLVTSTRTMEEAYAAYLDAELGIIELRDQLSREQKRLNIEALQYVQGLGQRARARLEGFLYRVARAASYQMVEPFRPSTHAQDFFAAFTKMLAEAKGGTPTKEDFEAAGAAFEDALKAITTRLLKHYDEHPLAITDTITVTLEPHQLAELNRSSGRVQIDLARMGALDEAVEDVRILDIRTKRARVEGAPEDRALNLHLEYRHGGVSRIRSGGELFVFRAGEYAVPDAEGQSRLLNDRMLWGSTVVFDGTEATTKDRRPNPSDASWLSKLVSGEKNQDMALQYQPGAWCDLRIQQSVTPNQYRVRVTELTLEIDVSAKGLADGLSTLSVRCAPGVEPLIVLDRPDVGERLDGYGTFVRTFDSRIVPRVRLRAPRYYGDLRFLGWRKVKGASPEELRRPMPVLSPEHARILARQGSGSTHLAPELEVDMRYHQVVIPVYGPASVLT